MGRYPQADRQIARLRRLAGSRIKIKRIRGTDNVIISGGGFKPIVRQCSSSNSSAFTIVEARKRILRKKYK